MGGALFIFWTGFSGVATVAGPYYVDAGGWWIPGQATGQAFAPGSAAAQAFAPGATKGQSA